jgi:Ca-activated chloride channel family protein
MVAFALQHGIMSQWTSFVAVEKRVVNIGGKMRTVAVPVEMADGVSYEGVMGGSVFAGVRPGTFNRNNQAISGGFGGGGAGGGATKSGTTGGGNLAGSYADQGLDLRVSTPEAKIHKSLKGKTGKLEVMILVQSWPEDWKKKLEEAGLKVEGEEKDLKVLFGTLDAKALIEIAKLDFVTEIKPIE